MHTERAVFVYTTYPTIVEAEEAGRALVEGRLAACVNILPGMVSYYWWNGQIERGEEVLLMAKTFASLSEAVSAAIKERHSYATPAMLVLPIESVEQTYFDWMLTETQPPQSQAPQSQG
jgi:periplasmic divalent cation tolerance protein